MSARLLTIDEIDSFGLVGDVPPSDVADMVIASVRDLDEREQLEPFLRRMLFDVGETPHGPAELVDLFTHKVTIGQRPTLAAFIIKGKSTRTVRPKDVSHQIYRLEKVVGLGLVGLLTSGVVLDAAKEQFVSTAQRIGSDYFLADAIDLARIFIAYGFLCPRDGRPVRTSRCQCGYSPTNRFFNVLQADALAGLEASHRLGQSRGLVVLPPGGGKTRVSAEDASRWGAKQILYVAHTHEILDVAQSEFESVFGSDAITRCATQADLSAPTRVRLSTIQLINRHLDTIEIESDYLVVDEFHHAAASSYRKLMSLLHPTYLLGLTATPFRGDRQDILDLCGGNVVVSFELRSGIDTGVLSPYHYFGCFDDIDYSTIKHNGIQYDVRDLERALSIPERDEAIIREWHEKAEGLPTIAFCAGRSHAERMVAAFQAANIPAAVYLDATPRDVRLDRLDRLRSGNLKVIATVDVLNEGADLPYVECLLFLRPTESQRVFYQQLGRGLRLYPGKARCVVIDFIGNFKNAYRIPEYQGLLPEPGPQLVAGGMWNRKALLNLPLGCRVEFEERVIDVFARQNLDPRYATRQNIAQILIYQYDRLSRRLGRRPTRQDVDRNCTLGAWFYVMVFGSWSKFESANA